MLASHWLLCQSSLQADSEVFQAPDQEDPNIPQWLVFSVNRTFLKANQNGPGHLVQDNGPGHPSGVSQADAAQPACTPAAQDQPGTGLMAVAFTWSIKQNHIENL